MKNNNQGKLSGGNSGFSSRFVASCNGKNVVLKSAKRIQAVSPPSDDLNESGGFVGSWIELRNADGMILYRRILHHFFNDTVEVATGRQGEVLSWQEAKGLDKSILIMVPEIPGSDHLAIMFKDPGLKDEKAVEIVRFSVKL
jgi:hypothetical protein